VIHLRLRKRRIERISGSSGIQVAFPINVLGLALFTTRAGRSLLDDSDGSHRRGVIPLLEGARVFPEAQPREWAASADSSSQGLGNNSGSKGQDFACLLTYFGGITGSGK
jgi:hypothetical protein